MGVHRVGRHEEPFGDLAIGEAVGRELSTAEAKGRPASSLSAPEVLAAGQLGISPARSRPAGPAPTIGARSAASSASWAARCRVRAEAMSGSSVRSGSQPDQHDI
jgi:hypothetical protein